jgi:hypothetical protein
MARETTYVDLEHVAAIEAWIRRRRQSCGWDFIPHACSGIFERQCNG